MNFRLKNKIQVALILILGTIIFSSCSSSSRGTNVTIANLTPTNGSVIYIGDPVTIQANLLADNDLSTYQIDIYQAIDSTTTSKSNQTRVVIPEAPFSATKKGSLSGTKITLSEVIDVTLYIGENNNPVQEGNYKLIVTVTDTYKNKAIVERDLVFKNK